MITVAIHQDRHGQISGFTVSGHAGFAEAGNDIVCAAVSAVTLTAAAGIRDVLGRSGIYETGEGHLRVRMNGDPDEKTEAVLHTMVSGLKEIQKQFPDRICFKNAGGESDV